MSPNEALTHICEGLLDDAASLTHPDVISAEELPPQYAELLVHKDHMTVRLAAFHGQPVRLRVLQEHVNDDIYRREIVLMPADSDSVVEVGVVRMNLKIMPPEVRAEILGHRKPLGDILIDHDILRRIRPRWFLRFQERSALLLCFGDPPPDVAYGRIGTIYFHEEPAIDLLEIVTDRKGGIGQSS